MFFCPRSVPLSSSLYYVSSGIQYLPRLCTQPLDAQRFQLVLDILCIFRPLSSLLLLSTLSFLPSVPRGISLQKRRTRFRDFENLTGIFWDFQRFLGIFNPKKSFGNKYQRFHKISLLYFCFAFVCIAQSTVELWPPHCNRYVIFFSLLKSHFNRISKTLIKQ